MLLQIFTDIIKSLICYRNPEMFFQKTQKATAKPHLDFFFKFKIYFNSTKGMEKARVYIKKHPWEKDSKSPKNIVRSSTCHGTNIILRADPILKGKKA